MLSIILGLLLIGFTVCACLPQVLDWGNDILAALRGGAPILAALIGIVAVFMGFADIQDKKEARKEQKEAEKALEEEAKDSQ